MLKGYWKGGGVGLIEVPNGQRAYFEKAYYDIFPDHVNYFSPQSLSILAARHGFEAIKISEEFNKNHLSLYVRKPNDTDTFNSVISQDKKTLNDILKDYNKVSIWGAGAKARSFIHLVESKEKIIHFYDVSKLRWGKYLDGVDVPMEKPEQAGILESDAILIFAGAYTKEIVRQLKVNYKYQKDIICFDKGIYILE